MRAQAAAEGGSDTKDAVSRPGGREGRRTAPARQERDPDHARYDHSLAEDLLADFETLRYRAKRIMPLGEDRWTFGQSLLLGLARLASPLL